MSALSQLLHELWLLLARFTKIPRTVWGSLAVAMTASWVAYFGSILIAGEVIVAMPWLLIGCLSLGLVAQLSAVIYALRTLLGGGAKFGDALAETMLPFLSVYWAFGFVDGIIHNVMDVINARFGFFYFADTINSMNPLSSPVVLVGVIAVLVASFVLRRWLEWRYDKTGRNVVGLASAVVEAVFLFLLGISGFRIVSWVMLWLGDRNLASWLDQALAWIKAAIHIDFPEFLAAGWEAVGVPLANMVFLPIAWLALAGVVAGVKAPKLAELWGAERSQLGSLRKALLAVVDAVYNDIDDKVLPFVYSLRRVFQAGWPFLGGYVLLFHMLHWLGGSLDGWIATLITLSGSNPLLLMPLGGLLDQVVITGLQLLLLAAAFQRVEELRLAKAPSPTPGWLNALLVGAVLAAVACAQSLTTGFGGASRAAVGEVVKVGRSEVGVSDARMGDEVVIGQDAEHSDQLFVVVRLSVFNAYPANSVTLSLSAGGSDYAPWDGISYYRSLPGFRSSCDVVFEVERSALAGGASIRAESAGYAAEFALGELAPVASVTANVLIEEVAP
ncbi:MAG: hypothetical protein LBI99_01595 [Propionibacteriaceae bacterium]|jgi:hypothetical protein|nr:hypothetical protein [Propionibacteriaceae bacterium]